MELALSLGDSPTPFTFLDKTPKLANNKDPMFSASLGSTFTTSKSLEDHQKSVCPQLELEDTRKTISTDPPFQLQLLPAAPVLHNRTSSKLHIPWLSDKQFVTEPGSNLDGPGKVFDVNRIPTANRTEETEDGTTMSSPNSTVSSFHLEFSVRNGRKRDLDVEIERASDDEEINGSTRKKLRLTKEQSAFLEESFKEHSTLNPKQKIALAKQLNLRPRQVEVWFQNRRARTKLKQTEVECEYLKRCCEKLTEENRRLQKEVQELRALKTTSQPFFMQLPATTLTMCPSCERTVTTTTNSNSNSNSSSRQKLLPFSNIQNQKLKSSTSNKNPVS